MITVFFSSQDSMMRGPLRRAVREVLPERDSMNYVALDMSETRLCDLANECLSLPLGYERKAVVADHFFYLAKTREKKKIMAGDDDRFLLSFFEKPDDAVSLFLTVCANDLDTNSSYYKALEKGGAKFLKIDDLTDNQWDDFIPKYFSKRGATIDVPAITELKERTQGDYALFCQEANKLVAYANEEEVTKDMVRALTPVPLEENSYELANALTRGNIKRALEVYRDSKIVANNGPIPLIHMLSRQFMVLDQVRYLSRRGYSAYDIGTALKISTARAKASLYSVSKMSEGCLHRALEQLYQTECSIFLGKMDNDTAFTLFLVNFTL